MADARAVVADRHARLRWIGIVTFCCAAALLVLTAAAAATGRAPWPRVLAPFVAMGLSLGTFGTNNDTFLHALADLARSRAVPEHHRAEWAHERLVRPARLASLHAAPRIAVGLPFAVVTLLVWAAWRAAQAWGLA